MEGLGKNKKMTELGRDFITHPREKNEKTKQFEGKLKLFLKIMIVSGARILSQKGMWEAKRKFCRNRCGH